MARMWTRFVSVIVLLAGSTFASDAPLAMSQYAHTAWKVRDGFAKGFIYSIAQTPDGYIWLGTEFGLLRFDAVTAVPWQPPDGQQLPARDIPVLLVTRDGSVMPSPDYRRDGDPASDRSPQRRRGVQRQNHGVR